MVNAFTKLEDLCLLNYYEGWYSGAIQDESYIGDATEFYFGWLTGIANEYGINTDFDESPDGCDALHDDIEEFLKENIIFIDLEEQFEYADEYIKQYDMIKDGYINDFDIFEAVDHSESDYKQEIYHHVIKEYEKKEYKII